MPDTDMTLPLIASLLGGGFVAAFLHAALPTHWLPFVLVGRAQRWSDARVLGAVTAAGLAHIASTALVGGLIAVAGVALDGFVAGVLPWLSAGLLILFGLFYLSRALVRRPTLAGSPGGQAALDLAEPTVSHAAAFWGLVLSLAISPGEVLLPFYLSQAQEGLVVLAALTVAFAAGTVIGMSVFTLLARAGWSVLRLERWARYEGVALGLALITVGLLVAMHQH